MMTEIDLIERLRKQSDPEHRLFDTAADEIEHLRAVLRLRKLQDAEIKRLRAVLDRVANSTVLRAREIAREALL